MKQIPLLLLSLLIGLGIVQGTFYVLRDAPISIDQSIVVVYYLVVSLIVFGIMTITYKFIDKH